MEGNVYPQGKSVQISLPLYTDFDGQYFPHLNSVCDCLYCFSPIYFSRSVGSSFSRFIVAIIRWLNCYDGKQPPSIKWTLTGTQ